MDGYIALHRKIIDSWIWQDPEFYRLWSYCLIKASFKEREIFLGQQIIKLKPGQFIIGREKLEEAMNIGLKNKRTAVTWWRRLQKLEKAQMLNIKTYNKFSVVTIENWGLYQCSDIENEQQNEQQTSNKRTTDEQQTITNNNVNNANKEKNDNKAAANAFQIYESNIGMLNPLQREKMLSWENDLSRELVAYAVTYSAEIGARGFGLVDSVISSWLKSNVRTVDDAKAFELERKNKKKQQFVRPAKQEVLPDWFDKEQKQTKQEASTTESSEDLEKKVAEIKAQLAARNEVQA
ncbi:TPA_asm: hypothetical protein GIN74_09075 [Listeria monocytogenes]|nr:hypothetical protein [Listeria monocytogenes]